jgi:hypothetical protein
LSDEATSFFTNLKAKGLPANNWWVIQGDLVYNDEKLIRDNFPKMMPKEDAGKFTLNPDGSIQMSYSINWETNFGGNMVLYGNRVEVHGPEYQQFEMGQINVKQNDLLIKKSTQPVENSSMHENNVSSNSSIHTDTNTPEKIDEDSARQFKKIPEILNLMHGRIKELRAMRAMKHIDNTTVLRIQAKIRKISPIPNKTYEKAQEYLKSGKEKKFEIYFSINSRLYIGSEYGKKYEQYINDIGGILETENYGLQKILSNDTEYKGLKKQLEARQLGISEKVSTSVRRYERYLYGISSVILFDELRIKSGNGHLPDAVEARMTQYSQKEDAILQTILGNVTKGMKSL